MRFLVVSLVALGAAVMFSGCSSSDSATLADKACGLVHRSIAVYNKSKSATTSAQARADEQKALGLLRRALAPASLASTGDGAWQALSATLSESNRVPEADLISALDAQCAGTG